MKFDAYQMVTDRICELLEQGVKPWAMPWTGSANYGWSGQTGKQYSFLNQMLLADTEKKYASIYDLLADVAGEWLTFNQVKERGGNVKKGEHGRKVVFFKMILEKDEDGNETNKVHPFLTVSTVFHVRQCEGIEAKYHKEAGQTYDFTENLDAEEIKADYLKRSGVKLETVKGDRAYYSPMRDTVILPMPDQFKSPEDFYSTLFHEITHSTGHAKRLNRVNGNVHFGDESYSLEELVAEIGSASICATAGISTEGTMTNSAAYVKSWLKALKNDKTMIVKAASRAEKAVRLILNIQEDTCEN